MADSSQTEETKQDGVADFAARKYEKHVMISYEKDSVGLVRSLVSELAAKRIPTFYSRPGSADVNMAMAEGVENAAVFVVVQTQKYQDARKCAQEFNYADQKGLPMISVLTDPDWTASGWLGAVTASHLRVQCGQDIPSAAAELAAHIATLWPGVTSVKPRNVLEVKRSHVWFPGGIVTGYWKQSGQTGEMVISFMVLKDQVIRGQGNDSVGDFTISGIYQDRNLEFVKQYIGQHSVVYKGTIDGEEGEDLTSDGLWTIGDMQGEYHLAFTKVTGNTNSSGDFILITHEAKTTPLVEKIATALREEGLKVWFSPEGCNDPDAVMAALGKDAAVVVPVMTKDFQASQQCREVMNYADGRGEPMVPIMAEPNWMQSGWLGVIMSGMLWVDFTKPAEFDAKIKHLLAEIKAAWPDAPYDDMVFDGAGAVEGWYEQGGKQTRVTVDHLELKDKRITGKGSDPVGVFTIDGKFKNREFSFIKQYTGKHAVDYQGNLQISKGLVCLRGKWSVGGYEGAFEFIIQKAPEKPKTRHIMLSYQWDIQPIVKRVYDGLTFHGLPLWFDIAGDMKGNINTAMADGVENANVFVCFTTARYAASKNCAKELNYANQLKHPIVPIYVDPEFKSEGWMNAIISNTTPVILDKSAQESKDRFDEKIQQIVDRVKAVWVESTVAASTPISDVFSGGKVTGYWLQNGSQGDMHIEYFSMQQGRVRGQGDDSVGGFTIFGTYENGKVVFDKQYIGAHLVVYTGTYNESENMVQLAGEWSIGPDYTGGFRLTCTK